MIHSSGMKNFSKSRIVRNFLKNMWGFCQKIDKFCYFLRFVSLFLLCFLIF